MVQYRNWIQSDKKKYDVEWKFWCEDDDYETFNGVFLSTAEFSLIKLLCSFSFCNIWTNKQEECFSLYISFNLPSCV